MALVRGFTVAKVMLRVSVHKILCAVAAFRNPKSTIQRPLYKRSRGRRKWCSVE